MSLQLQPIDNVEWVPRDNLTANSYNPNKMPKQEMELLKVSIMEDGWTQPIVARIDGEIVDGFHRWTTAADPEVAALTGGLVPVVRIKEIDPARQRMATIRHNRARGEHYVLSMADIVSELVKELNIDPDDLRKRLGMEREEIIRMLDRGKMTKRAGEAEFKQAWVPEKEKPT
jgi:ParB-like chromosome segregation protein Spo0J